MESSKSIEKPFRRVPEFDAWNLDVNLSPKKYIYTFKDQFRPFLAMYADGELDAFDEETFAELHFADLFRFSINVDPDELESDWASVTSQWKKSLHLLFGKLIARSFWSRDELVDGDQLRSILDTFLERGKDEGPPSQYFADEDKDWEFAIAKIPGCFSEVNGKNATWGRIKEALEEVCLKLGLPCVLPSPIENIRNIRQYYLMKDRSGESRLRLEIKDLNKKLDEQQRVIASLSFRHVLETLPGPDAQGGTATERWRIFWKKSFDAVVPATTHGKASTKFSKAKNGTVADPAHPVAQLLLKLGGTPRDNIKEFGNLLYSSLSANIHKFQGQFDIPDTGVFEQAFFEVLKPVHMIADEEGNPTNYVDWGKERARFAAVVTNVPEATTPAISELASSEPSSSKQFIQGSTEHFPQAPRKRGKGKRRV